MEVTLINHTPDPDKTVAIAARNCYSKLPTSDLNEKLDIKNVDNLIKRITESGHHSTLEHVVFTFGVDGISRACSHQLVRHRMASYNQKSQRYVTEEKSKYVIPDSIMSNSALYEIFDSAVMHTERAYKELIDLRVPKEDARYLLPNAIQTSIVVTMNARELMHFFKLRCCNRSQWEIRELAWKMLNICKEVAPKIFEFAGPDCLNSRCKEGTFTCGDPYSK